MKNLFAFLCCILLFNTLQAQTLEELKATKAEKEGVKKNIDKEIAELDKAIKEFPGWTRGLAGLIGLDFAGSNNWLANDIESNSSRGLGIAFNAYANGNYDKYFLRNNFIANLNTSRASNRDIDEDTGVEGAEQEITARASYLELSNLSGFYFAKNIAVSAKASYITTIFEFNDPGQLSFSAGLTWTPRNDFVAYLHPIGYQWTFPSNNFVSSTGAELGASYTGTLFPGVEWTSNFNAFLAYSGAEVEKNGTTIERTRGDLSNWTWINTFSVADIFKGIGLGLSVGLRNNKQLGFAKSLDDGGGLQTMYNLGLSYALSR